MSESIKNKMTVEEKLRILPMLEKVLSVLLDVDNIEILMDVDPNDL